ncbi:hypothetical protein WJX84_002267 [Apatococcus fuscideae]|uniref:Uncharacterized protein n=1 Tax=Apatococcus fuscideae TaxID=2026836 RepID=A0AAW1RQP6_9CHLO
MHRPNFAYEALCRVYDAKAQSLDSQKPLPSRADPPTQNNNMLSQASILATLQVWFASIPLLTRKTFPSFALTPLLQLSDSKGLEEPDATALVPHVPQKNREAEPWWALAAARISDVWNQKMP